MTTYSDSLLKATEDWRYSNPKMQVREQALGILLKRFGSELDENNDGSLSWAALGNGVRYIIIETRLGWLSQQRKMLDFVENSLRK